MIFKNNNKIANIYRGTLKISNVYRGGILVYTGEKTYDGLTFEALEASTIKYTPSTVATAQYSYDTVNWNSADNVTLNLNAGKKVFFKGNITGNQSTTNYANFTMTGKISASGSIMSLQAGNPQDKDIKYAYEFYKLFENCSSLIKAPELPATTLTERCYQNLFVSCGLTEPTALPATTLAVRCYQNLFNGCSNLTSAPELPATTMVDNCYANLFLNCSSLTTAPELPATTLDIGCYQGMFYHCTSLTTAPELPATTLVTDCYRNMFNGCSNLNYIKALFTTTPSSSYTANWVKEVASTGTFVKNKDATWNVTGIDGIPTGWTVQKEVDWKGLTFNALEPSTIKYVPSTVSTAQYSYDAVNWETANNVTLNLNKGDKVYFKGTITGNQSTSNKSNFTITGKIATSGSIMSMQDGNPQDKTLKYKYEFTSMFAGCTSLVKAPELPATTLSDSCYFNMFYNCKSLVNAPVLPATELKYECYKFMFDGCISLVNIQELPATKLADYCYNFMFNGCTSLTTAPELPATTLTRSCYNYMFKDCSKLNYIKALFTTTPGPEYTSEWLSGVASTGTFVKNKDATWDVIGVGGIPRGWTVETA